MAALTSRQEAFAQAVAGGKSLAEAYRSTYPRSKEWKDAAVWVKASEMGGKVAVRVAQLRAELADRTAWTRADSVRILRDIAERGDKNADRVAAVKAINAMHGYDAPVKVEHSGQVTTVTRRIVDGGAG